MTTDPRMDDLFLELLGEQKPFEIVRKRDYDFISLKVGFKNVHETFLRDDLPGLFSGTPRSLVVRIESPEVISDEVLQSLLFINSRFRAESRGICFFPLLSALATQSELKVIENLQLALEMLGIAPNGAINSEIVETICRSAKTVFAIQYGTQIHFSGVALRTEGQFDSAYSGFIEFSGGGVESTFSVSAEHGVLQGLMVRMTGASGVVAEEVITSGVCEIANIVAGHAKAQLNESGYEVKINSLPNLVTPEFQPMMSFPDQSTGVVIRTESDLGHFWLEIRFFKRDAM